jgi:tetratricopeptide (TPR) repeat protein
VPPVRSLPVVLTLSLAFTGFFLIQTLNRFHDPYPLMTASLSSPETQIQDVLGVALGLRRLAADLAWVQTLQYYGTPEEGQTEAEFENGLGQYPKLLSKCRHTTNLDPYFTYVYYYGGASLGWNLNRLAEGEALLKEGITYNPNEWRIPQYLAAMAYQKNHNVEGLTRFLESIVEDPGTPLMVKSLLANVYKKQGEFEKAIRLWELIYQTGDPDYRSRAIEQIKDIARLRHAPHLDKKTPF